MKKFNMMHVLLHFEVCIKRGNDIRCKYNLVGSSQTSPAETLFEVYFLAITVYDLAIIVEGFVRRRCAAVQLLKFPEKATKRLQRYRTK